MLEFNQDKIDWRNLSTNPAIFKKNANEYVLK